MNNAASDPDQELWTRPEPEAVGPNRGFGGYYRSSDRIVDGKLFRGVPLETAEDAVVTAVRMGYRVVDAQIERGMRIARNLRTAAEKSGSGDPKQALESAEQLVEKASLAALRWIEEVAGDRKHPLRRLLGAEYRMLGAMFGLVDAEREKKQPSQGTDEVGIEARSDADERQRRRSYPTDRVRIVHLEKDPEKRRPVKEVITCILDASAPKTPVDIRFVLVSPPKPLKTMKGHLERDDCVILSVEATINLPAGIWRAGVFEEDTQVGLVEIEL